MTVNNLEALEALIERVKVAQATYATFTQAQVDRIFHHAALAANTKRIPLAKQAVQETRMGIVEDKVIKNHFASEMVYNKYKDEKTCGIIENEPGLGCKRLPNPWASWRGSCLRRTRPRPQSLRPCWP
jgi:acetaldehyde dehydrogenase/alcohol dehydrogenase